MGRECSTNGEKRNAYSLLVGNVERKRPLISINMGIKEIAGVDMKWIDLS
jgi:hypothetical protein